MHFIGSGHIPLEHTETLQESPDLILALLDFAPRDIRSGQTSIAHHKIDWKSRLFLLGMGRGFQPNPRSNGYLASCSCQQFKLKLNSALQQGGAPAPGATPLPTPLNYLQLASFRMGLSAS